MTEEQIQKNPRTALRLFLASINVQRLELEMFMNLYDRLYPPPPPPYNWPAEETPIDKNKK